MRLSLVHCGPEETWSTMLPLASSENPQNIKPSIQAIHPPTTINLHSTSCALTRLPHTLPSAACSSGVFARKKPALHCWIASMVCHVSLYGNLTVFVCLYKTLRICVRVFAFHLSGTFSRDFPYPAPAPQQATQRERRGKKPVWLTAKLTPIYLHLSWWLWSVQRANTAESRAKQCWSLPLHINSFEVQKPNPAPTMRHWGEIKSCS